MARAASARTSSSGSLRKRWISGRSCRRSATTAARRTEGLACWESFSRPGASVHPSRPWMAAWRTKGSWSAFDVRSETSAGTESELRIEARARAASRRTAALASVVACSRAGRAGANARSPRTVAATERIPGWASVRSRTSGVRADSGARVPEDRAFRAICPSAQAAWRRVAMGWSEPRATTSLGRLIPGVRASANWAPWRTRRSAWLSRPISSSGWRSAKPDLRRAVGVGTVGSWERGGCRRWIRPLAEGSQPSVQSRAHSAPSGPKATSVALMPRSHSVRLVTVNPAPWGARRKRQIRLSLDEPRKSVRRKLPSHEASRPVPG